MTVKDAHALTNRIEQAMEQLFPGMEVTVHIEPIEERQAWEDSALLEVERAERARREASK
jgi:divalent metal cation (Fe/Co/Zn/Cd) transporter